MSQHRNTVSISFKPQDNPDVQRLVVEGKSHRIFVFCAGDLNGSQDIAFPHQSELKVNGEDVRANLRGLKNKPGSTRPVDITNYLRCKHANYLNQINFTYALTNKVSYDTHSRGGMDWSNAACLLSRNSTLWCRSAK
jgi:E3 SUMO-protein ligase PIAS1